MEKRPGTIEEACDRKVREQYPDWTDEQVRDRVAQMLAPTPDQIEMQERASGITPRRELERQITERDDRIAELEDLLAERARENEGRGRGRK